MKWPRGGSWETIDAMHRVVHMMLLPPLKLGLAFLLLTAAVWPAVMAQSPPTWDTARVWTDFEAASQRPELVLRLDLTRQKWKQVDHRLRRFRQLRELTLDRNKLDSLPPWFGELTTLEHLSIRSNVLTNIPECLLQLDSLRVLDLSDNMIEGIPEDIDALAALERLILWSNVVGHFPPSLSQLEHLIELDLLNNEMSVDEQIWVRELLPGRTLSFSPPCRCQFDD